ncbi:hypothetical protein B0H19DRAFT_1064340 [Mycena capillaripes]|nr:hypothetical protein B0H19DRAFT_1064340 [Mycena capillaripes]
MLAPHRTFRSPPSMMFCIFSRGHWSRHNRRFFALGGMADGTGDGALVQSSSLSLSAPKRFVFPGAQWEGANQPFKAVMADGYTAGRNGPVRLDIIIIDRGLHRFGGFAWRGAAYEEYGRYSDVQTPSSFVCGTRLPVLPEWWCGMQSVPDFFGSVVIFQIFGTPLPLRRNVCGTIHGPPDRGCLGGIPLFAK